MSAASHGCTLHRGCVGIVGINFNNPTKAVGFVGVLRSIKTSIVLVPTVAAAAFFQTPAFFVIAEFVATIKVIDKVFFRGKVSAPRCNATGAIIEGAQDHTACGVGGCFHERVACSGATQFGACGGSNASCVFRRVNDLPLSAFVLHFNNGHAMCSLRLANLLGTPIGHAIFEQQTVVHVLVVHGQQTAFRAFQGVVMNAIVVHSNLGFLLGSGVTGVVFESVVLTCNAHGVAPRCNDVGHIALWHSDRVGCGNSHALKANFCCRTHAQSGAAGKGCSTANGAQRC